MMRCVNRLFAVLLISAMIILLAGCRKPGTSKSSTGPAYDPAKDPLVNPPSLFEPPPKDRSKITTDETLYISLEGNPNTLNPLFVSSGYDFTVTDEIYQPIIRYSNEMEWRINENYVESFEESDDHTIFIVKLKPDLKWHDGRPFTAHDVVYSWKEILDPSVPCMWQKPSTRPITECVALDDLTIKYVQPVPLATRYWNLIFPIVPKHIFEIHKADHPDLKTGEYYNRQARLPIGNGPYRMVEWQENTRIVLERWEDFPGEKPYFKKIIFKIILDQNMAMLAFDRQEVDVVNRVSPQKYAKGTETESFKKVGHKAWGIMWQYSYIGWNMDGSNPFFADKRVRQAMTLALNHPMMLEKVYYNLHTKCHGIYHPDSWMYDPQVKLLEYDLRKSKDLLNQAGWRADPEDGWRYKIIDGERAPLEFSILSAKESPNAPKIAAIFQEDLKRIGVRMKLRLLEWSSLLVKMRKHEFQAFMASWGTGTDPDQGWSSWRSEEYEKGRNYVGYSNPRVDELFELGRTAFDIEKRIKIYQEIHKLIYEDQPYTWLSNEPILCVFNKRIRGVQFSPRGIFNFAPSFEGWWVSADAMP